MSFVVVGIVVAAAVAGTVVVVAAVDSVVVGVAVADSVAVAAVVVAVAGHSLEVKELEVGQFVWYVPQQQLVTEPVDQPK